MKWEPGHIGKQNILTTWEPANIENKQFWLPGNLEISILYETKVWNPGGLSTPRLHYIFERLHPSSSALVNKVSWRLGAGCRPSCIFNFQGALSLELPFQKLCAVQNVLGKKLFWAHVPGKYMVTLEIWSKNKSSRKASPCESTMFTRPETRLCVEPNLHVQIRLITTPNPYEKLQM